ncbi:DPP IV N-terminal domain-containing protein [Balneola sp. MJW-20]|uniref:S9 family peptidase n=1 Tax=Gracilimonas aurantiaca TaxID=3234185 RepID=UPI003464F392
MRKFNYTLTTLLLVLMISPSMLAQLRGLDLYNEMGSPGFIEYDGISGLRWLPGDMGYLETESDEDGITTFYKVDPRSEERTPLFDAATVNSLVSQFNEINDSSLEGLPFTSFSYVMDNEGIFFTLDGNDYVYHLESDELRDLYKPEVEKAPYTEELMRGMQFSQLWNGTYSNDYTKFAHVKGYDIYVVDTETGEEKRLTYGSEEQMNGRPSWVYPEEFGQRDAYWFSPDDSKIAYLQYNETQVYQYPIIHELQFETGLELERYPKAGEENPTVNLFIVDIESGEIEQVPTNSDPDTYIVRPTWRNDGTELTFRRLNRQQNHLELLAYDLDTKKVRTILEEREDAYINLHDNFIQLDDNETFIWTSEVSGYNHIYHYNFEGELINQVTKGDFPVGSLVNVDQENEKIYFTAYHNMGLDSYFHSVNFDGSGLNTISNENGRHSISMNEAAEYYTDSYSSFEDPRSVVLYTNDGEKVRDLRTADAGKVREHGLIKPELFKFKAADGTTDLVGMIYKPADFDPNKKYPIVLPLYGGPESQDVSNTYSAANGYQQMAQLGFIVIRANYRGSGNRGKKFATLHYGKLGTIEMDDYAQAVKTVSKNTWADGSRVGVYGHSYGGYSTALLMLRYPEIFHVGVSGAPVTDWRNYDTIYTERYMDTPQNNLEGYEVGSAMNYADQLKGKLLIVHGTTDNNVHPSNSIQLIDALVKAGKDFDVMFYPENRHGIRGAAGRHYSMKRLEYLVENLMPENLSAEDMNELISWN